MRIERTTRRWVIAIVGWICLALTNGALADPIVRYPYFAFNSGTYDPDIITTAVQENRARVAEENTNVTKVEHELIEVFQRSSDTRDQESYYALVTSSFVLTLYDTPEGGRTSKLLSHVSVEYVRLGFDGTPKFDDANDSRTQKLEFSKAGTVWTRKTEPGRCLNVFYPSLVPARQKTLATTIGHLYFNPASPPVPFRMTDGEYFSRILSLVVPGIAEHYAFQLAENALTDSAWNALKTKLDNGVLRWGSADRLHIDDPSTLERYRLYGAGAMQRSWPCRTSAAPNPPTNVSVQ